jgi:Heterokaryon incompatibility protein (HET)
MRLLRLKDNGEFSLVEFVGNIPRYAVLSHTWGVDDEEVTFKDLVDGAGKSKSGYSKIRFCGKQAAKDGLQFFWVDTCCIDKSSSAELSEAINSMFRWYHNADKCYVYLSDVLIGGSVRNDLFSQWTWKPAFQHSRWFTRGWTLQELVAPTCVEFFSAEGERIGDKHSMVQEIHKITGISVRALQGRPLSQFSVRERISWAARRKTSRGEDEAYSLLGILEVSMPLIYGEGRERAFVRLQKEIKESLKDELPILPQGAGAEDDSQNRASSSNDVFNSVITGFRDSLGPKEKEMFKEFKSSKEMLGDLRSRCKDVRNSRKLFSLCSKIERFAAAWEPFFEVMTIFVQTHLEFAGLAWGAIRLVFIVSNLSHLISLKDNDLSPFEAGNEAHNLSGKDRVDDSEDWGVVAGI